MTIPKDNYKDPDFCLTHLIHFWNVPIFKSGRKIFMERMSEAGWCDGDINEMNKKALNKSNWNKPSFYNMMIRNPILFEEKTT